MTRKKNWSLGDVLQIDLRDGSFAFGRVLGSPLIAFYDLNAPETPPIEYVCSCPIVFKIWVMNSCISNDGWKRIGNRQLEKGLLDYPTFFKQDKITKKYSLYKDGQEIPASKEECEVLEKAAVWSAEHVEDRLRDHFAGRKNKWVESLKP